MSAGWKASLELGVRLCLPMERAQWIAALTMTTSESTKLPNRQYSHQPQPFSAATILQPTFQPPPMSLDTSLGGTYPTAEEPEEVQDVTTRSDWNRHRASSHFSSSSSDPASRRTPTDAPPLSRLRKKTKVVVRPGMLAWASLSSIEGVNHFADSR